MIRTLTVLATAACLATPVFADEQKSKKADKTELAQAQGGGDTGGTGGTTGSGGARGGGRTRDRDRMRDGDRMRNGDRMRDGGRMQDSDRMRSDRMRDGMMTTHDGKAALLLNPYPAYERPLGQNFWRTGMDLTPRTYLKYRAMGFSQEEVFLIANASRATGLEPYVFGDALNRGLYARQISLEYGITPRLLTDVRAEWRTAEWAAAVGEPVYRKRKLGVFF